MHGRVRCDFVDASNHLQLNTVEIKKPNHSGVLRWVSSTLFRTVRVFFVLTLWCYGRVRSWRSCIHWLRQSLSTCISRLSSCFTTLRWDTVAPREISEEARARSGVEGWRKWLKRLNECRTSKYPSLIRNLGRWFQGRCRNFVRKLKVAVVLIN